MGMRQIKITDQCAHIEALAKKIEKIKKGSLFPLAIPPEETILSHRSLWLWFGDAS
jgi:hypothetical protein